MGCQMGVEPGMCHTRQVGSRLICVIAKFALLAVILFISRNPQFAAEWRIREIGSNLLKMWNAFPELPFRETDWKEEVKTAINDTKSADFVAGSDEDTVII